MNICRFKNKANDVGIGLVVDNESLLDLTPAGITHLTPVLESDDPVAQLRQIATSRLPRVAISSVKMCAPVERQEVWAAGVTYLRSKAARMEESEFSANAYDRVYVAERPEIFFKSLPEKVVATGEPVGIRRDAKWNVPEPELALVLNSRGQIVGHTIGNDMSSRDIEGENPLYLPQAKVYDRSTGLGPCLLVTDEPLPPTTTIAIEIHRDGVAAFSGSTQISQIKRKFPELAEFLFRDNSFPRGAYLMTGTGVVPPDDFTLRSRDEIRITIEPIGTLINTVA
jgi:2-dehydro-3-deoxy-D-arabinonate dehydratase